MQVLTLQLLLKYDADLCKNEISAIHRAIRQPFQRAMHSPRTIAFVVKTPETSQQLVDRLGAQLEALCFENWYCQTAGPDIVGKYGNIDPLPSRIKAAYAEIRNREHPKNVRQLQIRRFRPKVAKTKRLVSSTSVEMAREEKAQWRPSRKPKNWQR
jgi:hypothetical protein